MLRGIDAEASVGTALNCLTRVVFQVNKECGYHTIDFVGARWCVNDFFVAKHQWYDPSTLDYYQNPNFISELSIGPLDFCGS